MALPPRLCVILCRLSIPSEGDSKLQAYLSINPVLPNTRPAAAHILLLFTVQLFPTAARGQSLLPDGKVVKIDAQNPAKRNKNSLGQHDNTETETKVSSGGISQGQETGKTPTYSYLVLGNIEWGNQSAQELLNELEIVAPNAP